MLQHISCLSIIWPSDSNLLTSKRGLCVMYDTVIFLSTVGFNLELPAGMQ